MKDNNSLSHRLFNSSSVVATPGPRNVCGRISELSPPRSLRLALCLVMAAFFGAIMGAGMGVQAASFTSTTSGVWGNVATWGGAGVPTAADNVTIATGTTVSLDTTRSSANLTINSGGTLDLTGNTFNFATNNTSFINNGTLTSSVAGATFFLNGNGTTHNLGGAGTYSSNLNFFMLNMTLTVNPSTSMTYPSATDTLNFEMLGGSTLIATNPLTISAPSVGAAYVGFSNFGGTLSGAGGLKTNGNVIFGGGGTSFTAPVEIVSGTATGNMTLNGAFTIDSGATFKQNFTLILNGDLNILSGGTLDLNGNTLSHNADNTSIINNGTLANTNAALGAIFINGNNVAGGVTQHFGGAGNYGSNVQIQSLNGLPTIIVNPSTSMTFATAQNAANIVLGVGSTWDMTNALTITAPAAGANYVGLACNSAVTGAGGLKTNGNVILSGNTPLVTAPVEIVSGSATGNGTFNGAFTIDSGATFQQNFTLNLNGDLNILAGGTLDLNGNTVNHNANNTSIINNGTLANTNAASGQIFINGNNVAGGVTQHFGGAGNYGSNVRIQSLNGLPTIIVNPSTSMTFASAQNATNFEVDSGSTWDMTNTLTITAPAAGANYVGVAIFGAVNGAGGVKTNGNVNLSGAGSLCTAPIEIVSGTATGVGTFNGLFKIDSGATFKQTQVLNLKGDLTIQSGATFDVSGWELDFSGNNTTFTNNGAVVNTGGLNNLFFLGNGTPGAINQHLATSTGSFTDNLLERLINNVAVVLDGDAQLGAVTIDNATSLDISNHTLKLSHAGTALTINGTIITPGSTVEMNGTAAQTVTTAGITYNNLTINNAAGVNLPAAITVPGTLTLANGLFTAGAALTMGNNALIRRSDGLISGTPTFSASVDVEYFGANPITTGNELPASSTVLRHVTMNNSNTVTLNNARTINGTLFLNSGTFSNGGNLSMASGTTIQRSNGILGAAPTFGTSVNVNYLGSSAVTTGPEIPSSASVLNDLLINRSGGVNLGAGGASVNGTLFLINGTFAVGTSTLVVNSAISITAGALTSGVTGTINYNQQANGQPVLAINYGNLIFSNFNKALPSGTIGIAGAFTPGSAVGHIITGNTIDFNGGGSQTIPAFNYNNLTSSNSGGRTLVNGGTIGIAGTFTPGSNSYTITGNTVDFNGAGSQTIPAFNYFNLSSLTGGARTLAASGIIGVANTFGPGAHAYTLSGSTVEYNGSGVAQSLPAGFTTYNNLNLNNLAGTTGFAGLTVNGLLDVKAGTFTSSSTYNNVQVDSGATLAATAAGTINVSGNWTNNGSFTGSTGTVNFNGGVAQSIGGANLTAFNNLQISNTSGGVGLGRSEQVDGTLTLTSGALSLGANALTLNGAISSAGGTLSGGATSNIAFGGSGASTSLPAVQNGLNNLTINRANGISLGADLTVNGLLTLTLGDLTTGASTLTMPNTATASGATDVVGNVKRTGFTTGNTLSFGNPFTSISFQSGALPSDITVNLVKAVPASFPTAVARTYSITANGGGVFSATLRLHYLDTERGANAEGATLSLWRFGGSSWSKSPATAFDISNNWSENNAVTQFSLWTLNSTAPTASPSTISGRIVDAHGAPVEGAVVRLDGAQTRKFITDANGFYRFENVETSGFYTVTPSRVNYTFSPSSRSFSQLGETTEAAFGATATGQNANPLDTPEYFVRQNYLDFLGREPDEAGFNFWSDQILECGEDNACIERRRENVSAAYFLSIEFQQTGGLVDGLYKASYGVRPEFAEFMPDTRSVGQDVVVGREGWQAKLAANKQAFVEAFVNREAFHAAYDGMDNSLFVDTLINHTGVSFTSTERARLVSGLADGTLTRAAVVRSIAENENFAHAKFNEAFVMMEYFGYLRRDPDASGYAFWLNKLGEFDGNFERADMVKAFIVSGEYRERFPR